MGNWMAISRSLKEVTKAVIINGKVKLVPRGYKIVKVGLYLEVALPRTTAFLCNSYMFAFVIYTGSSILLSESSLHPTFSSSNRQDNK